MLVIVNNGQTIQTYYPANTASWGENDVVRYIRLFTDETITGEDVKSMADVYALVNDVWVKFDWDEFDEDTCDSEMLPFNADQYKVVFTNGLEWVITNEA